MKCSSQHGHFWEVAERRLANGWLDVKGERELPPRWRCALCGAEHVGDPAPDGTTARASLELKYENLARWDRA